MKFSKIIGGEELTKMLVRGVDQGRVSHAQLFVGKSGYGALPAALAYAQYINCLDPRPGDSCGVCSSCVKMETLVHPDVHFVFPVNSPKGSGGSTKPTSDYFLPQWRALIAQTGGYFDEPMWYSAINIDNQQGIITKAEADEVIRKLSFKSFEGRYKIMIVWLPERMRAEASNTLLKILEEPWEKTIFLLVCESPERLLPTILSRTQEVVVQRIELTRIQHFLTTQRGVDSTVASKVARLSGGDLIEAVRLSVQNSEPTAQEDFELFTQLMRLSYNDKHLELLEWAETVAELGREHQKRFLDSSVSLLRNSYMLNAGMDNLAYLWGAELDFCKKFAPFIGNHNIESLVSQIELAKAQVSQNGNSKIIFAHFALVVSKLIVK